jgi:glycosyltransferase involved in cell wall biosynthesis
LTPIADMQAPSAPHRSPEPTSPDSLRDAPIAVMWRQFGPYHAARLHAAAETLTRRGVDIHAIEIAGKESSYDWEAVETTAALHRRTLFPAEDYSRLKPADIRRRVRATLEQTRPDVVAVNGWAFPESHAAIAWCRRNHRALVVMAESNPWRHRQRVHQEWVKRWLLRQCDAALVGGSLHRRYLVSLGMPAERIFLGYDIVDSEHFAREVRRCREERAAGNRPYLLSVVRFVWQKNLVHAMRAYADYCRCAGDEAWEWVLCGDGPLKDEIIATRRELGLDDRVHLTGFVQLDDLPRLYADAGALWLPSISETWGLVVNEAMAGGLPVLVSQKAGCSADLVDEGRNGWTFDPTSTAEMSDVLLRLHRCEDARRAEMGRHSERIIAHWGPDRFGDGLSRASQAALARLKSRRRTTSLIDRLCLGVLDP